MRTTLLATSLLLAASIPAQMNLEKLGDGGAVPGKSSLQLSGTPNTPYLILLSENEAATEPLPGVKLAIDLTYLGLCLNNPFCRGTLDAKGKASTSFQVPNLASLHGTKLSVQSLELSPIGNVSNLIRVTLQKPDTFAPTWNKAFAPIVTGQGFVQKNGKVLLLGGSGPVVQQYDPALESFKALALVPSGNVLATQTQLPDGTILVTGGIGTNGQPTKTAFVYDPATNKSTTLTGMKAERAGHTATLLKDGRVLIVGGAKSLDFTSIVKFLAGIQKTSEYYDPKKKTFSSGPSLLEQKMFHSATLLGNGEVLVAGGFSVVPILNIPTVSLTAQSYTPSLKVFGFPRTMAKARMLHGATALGNGKALLAGGLTIDFTKFLKTLNVADLGLSSVNDAVTYTSGFFGGFSKAMTLSKGRLLPAVASLGNSGALVAGGFNLQLSTSGITFQALKESDIFDGKKIIATGSMLTARVGAVAVPLPDGTVLITGGAGLDSEIYQPK